MHDMTAILEELAEATHETYKTFNSPEQRSGDKTIF